MKGLEKLQLEGESRESSHLVGITANIDIVLWASDMPGLGRGGCRRGRRRHRRAAAASKRDDVTRLVLPVKIESCNS